MPHKIVVMLPEVDFDRADQIKNAFTKFFQENAVAATVTLETSLEGPGATVVYTDGGCDNKGSLIGAYAAVIKHPDGTKTQIVGTNEQTTNNRMELMAVIEALKVLPMGPPIQVVLDSEYVAKGVTEWSKNWVRNGWRNAKGEPVINKDLWIELLKLYQGHDVKFSLIFGHAGNAGNEEADALCTNAIAALHKQLIQKEVSTHADVEF